MTPEQIVANGYDLSVSSYVEVKDMTQATGSNDQYFLTTVPEKRFYINFSAQQPMFNLALFVRWISKSR